MWYSRFAARAPRLSDANGLADAPAVLRGLQFRPRSPHSRRLVVAGAGGFGFRRPREGVSINMARSDPAPRGAKFIILASICVVIAALWFMQDVLIPLALAVLVTFLFTPVVHRLERWGL